MALASWQRQTVAGTQYGSIYGARGTDPPEKRLLIAVLLNAVLEYQDVVSGSRRRDDPHLDELVAWFQGRDRAWPFSFENLCAQLDLDPDSIRERLGTMALQVPGRRSSGLRRIR